MGCETGFRRRGVPPGGRLAESVREEFLAVLRSGLSPTAAGVSCATGRQWAGLGEEQRQAVQDAADSCATQAVTVAD